MAARTASDKPTFLEPEYPFEWAGAFELSVGDYTLSLQEGPDPAMKIALCEVLAADEASPAKAAERVFAFFSIPLEIEAPGAVIEPGLERGSWSRSRRNRRTSIQDIRTIRGSALDVSHV